MSCSKCAPATTAPAAPTAVAVPAPASAGPTAAAASDHPIVALVGNPNVGKSTLFNHLTGGRQTVRNAPGTTVEMFQGRWAAAHATVIDLPGTYSLIPNSPDEAVVADTLADPNQRIDLVIAVLDATSLKRSLYLLGQIAQTGRPTAGVITMGDQVSGEPIDAAALSAVLGIPIVSVDARSRSCVKPVLDLVTEAVHTRPHFVNVCPDPAAPGYHAADAAEARASIGRQDLGPTEQMERLLGVVHPHQSRCCAAQSPAGPVALPTPTLACQTSAPAAAPAPTAPASTAPAAASACAEMLSPCPASAAPLDRANAIFNWVNAVHDEAVAVTDSQGQPSVSDRIDSVLLNPIIGTVIFFSLMWGVFRLMGSDFVAWLQEIFEAVFDGGPDVIGWSVAQGLSTVLATFGWDGGWIESLLVDGVLTGIGVAASFVPLMFIMFVAIAILEDSGYMARAAFLGDRLMRVIGLDGRVIMPLVVGFGCNLPALAAIRTLPNARQRLATTLIIPWASCSARVTIYILVARIFFGANSGNVVFALYLISLALMVLGGLALKPLITRHEGQAPLMLVLPPYQPPRIIVTLRSAALRAGSFITGAGKIIVVMTVVIWAMMATPVAAPSAADLAANSAEVASAQARVEAASAAAELAQAQGADPAVIQAAQDAVDEAKQSVPIALEESYSFGNPQMPQEYSLYGRLAGGLAPVFAPAGFDDWHMAGALMTGFVAKETVISSIVASYNMGDEAVGSAEDDGTPTAYLTQRIGQTFMETTGAPSPTHPLAQLAAFAFLVFVLAYTPCLATVAEQARQIGWRWALADVAGQLAIAYVLATLIYQIGRLFIG